LETLYLRGKVFTGKGEGAKFIKLPWVERQVKEKLGIIPYPGTLNIKLTGDSVKRKEWLMKAKGIEISPPAGFCHGKLFKAYLGDNLECAVVIPEVVGYSEDVIEIIASTDLREKLGLVDGNVCRVKIEL
jgi:riboflavin kinase